MDDIFDIHASFCRIFTDPKRLRIMWALRDGEKTVGELAEIIGSSLPNTSQHLRLMRSQGAVSTRRDGRSIHYRVANDHFVEGCTHIRRGILEETSKRGAMAEAAEEELDGHDGGATGAHESAMTSRDRVG